MPISNYAGNKLLDVLSGKTSYSLPTTYMGLFTTMPTGPGNAGTEMTGGSYARTDVHTSFAAASGKSAATNATISITVTNATVLGIGIWDASTAGNLLYYAQLLQLTTAESNTFATTGEGIEVLTLNNGGPVGNVTVKDSSDVTTYTLGTDYYIQPETGKIVRITTGTITSGQTMHVTYYWPTTRSGLNDGDIIQISSGNFSISLLGFH